MVGPASAGRQAERGASRYCHHRRIAPDRSADLQSAFGDQKPEGPAGGYERCKPTGSRRSSGGGEMRPAEKLAPNGPLQPNVGGVKIALVNRNLHPPREAFRCHPIMG
jgi:hypothetical protein